MKKYFEYSLNKEIESELINYYENNSLEQHSSGLQNLKTNIKLKRINKLITINNNSNLLDIGCSHGSLLKFYSKNIKKGVGIDISKNVIKQVNKLNDNKKLEFCSFDGSNYDSEIKFDYVFLIDVLEHSFKPNDLIKIIKNNIKNNGKIIIEVPFTGWLSELIFGKYHQGHLRYYDPNYLEKYLSQKGIKVIKLKVYNSVPLASFFLKYKSLWVVLNKICNLIPSKFYPYFGEIIVICQKNGK